MYNKISVIGLGYVGLPLAIEFGKKHNVLGFDINTSRIKELNNKIDSTLEVTSEEFSLSKNITFSSNEVDLEDSDIFIITVPTPIDHVKRPDLSLIKKATELVSKYLKKGSIVIYESTVFPGCTEEICVPILEVNTSLKYNKDFFCGYSPERINPGDKVNTITKITKVTSGSNKKVAKQIDDLYKTIIEAGTFLASSIKVAEAAKVIENTQRDLNISLVNELSVIFNRLNIDTLDVLKAAESKWNFLPFRPGMVGGHCIGVDPYYLTHKAEEVGYNPQVILAGRRINDNMGRYAAKNIIKKMIKNKIDVSNSTVGILGITFKENCPDIRNTKVIDLINELKSWNINVCISDPWANKQDVKDMYGLDLVDFKLIKNIDSIIVAVGHKEYRKLKLLDLKRLCKGSNPVLADIKSLYEVGDIKAAGFDYFRF
jgi:UDP-N-acetyl-D-glucosamine/UDP-N-acetyl-D-galactosamine dehydrogenase